jgi:hypothetical protein
MRKPNIEDILINPFGTINVSFIIDNTFLDKFPNGSTVYFIVGIAEMVEKGDNLFINGYTNYSFNRKVVK